MAQFGLNDLVQLPPVDADPIEDRPDDALAFGQQRRQQVQRVDLRMAAVGRQFLRPRHRLLGLQGQFVEAKCHDFVSSPVGTKPGVGKLRTARRSLQASQVYPPSRSPSRNGDGSAGPISSSCRNCLRTPIRGQMGENRLQSVVAKPQAEHNTLWPARCVLAHNVYFSLNDNSEDAKQKLVASCKKHLSGHPGTVFFAVGVLAEEYDRRVNDRDFDVALHVVFRTKALLNDYMEAQRHLTFIEENKGNWKKVRVFDSHVAE